MIVHDGGATGGVHLCLIITTITGPSILEVLENLDNFQRRHGISKKIAGSLTPVSLVREVCAIQTNHR